MSGLEPRSSATIAFLERLLGMALEARLRGRGEGKVKLSAVRLHGEGAVIEVELSALGGLVSGAVPIQLDIVSTSPERTVLRWSAGAKGLAQLAGAGLGMIPRPVLDGLVRSWLGEGVQLEGDRVTLDHRELLRRVTRRT